MESSISSKIRKSFTGKEFDNDGASGDDDNGMNLYYFGKRFYDPEIARWISADPKEQYWDAYSYTGGNPVNLIDPDGLEANEKGDNASEKNDNEKQDTPGSKEMDKTDKSKDTNKDAQNIDKKSDKESKKSKDEKDKKKDKDKKKKKIKKKIKKWIVWKAITYVLGKAAGAGKTAAKVAKKVVIDNIVKGFEPSIQQGQTNTNIGLNNIGKDTTTTRDVDSTLESIEL